MTTRYTKDHEYIRIEGDTGTVGITDYAQSQLGDVVFVELPSVGKTLEKGGEAAVVESVKAASEVYAPVSGEVVDGQQRSRSRARHGQRGSGRPRLVPEDAAHGSERARRSSDRRAVPGIREVDF